MSAIPTLYAILEPDWRKLRRDAASTVDASLHALAGHIRAITDRAFAARNDPDDRRAVDDLSPVDSSSTSAGGRRPTTWDETLPCLVDDLRVLDVRQQARGRRPLRGQSPWVSGDGDRSHGEYVGRPRPDRWTSSTALLGFHHGSALEMPFADGSSTERTCCTSAEHPDKTALFSEIARVLGPGGTFAVYDVMRAAVAPSFPVPRRQPRTSAPWPRPTPSKAAGPASSRSSPERNRPRLRHRDSSARRGLAWPRSAARRRWAFTGHGRGTRASRSAT